MKALIPIGAVAAIVLGALMFWKAGWDLPPVDSVQYGYRGTAMEQNFDREAIAALKKANIVPESLKASDTTGTKVKDLPDVYRNVKLLGDLTEDQFNTLMANFAEWVAPKEGDNAGCAYCHNVENMADDSLYTHKVASRMIQMTRTINSTWKPHVGETGVVCYTCHHGQPVPKNVWFNEATMTKGSGWLGFDNGQNRVAKNNGLTSLPYNALPAYLLGEEKIRVHTLTALPSGNTATIMDTEKSYGLMVHMSEALGVNCTFCHNSRAFYDWSEGPSTRVTAWHGIRMTRDLNKTYLDPLQSTFPPNRLGPTGDAPKLNCATCHQGVNKPLLGVSMLKDYKVELGGPNPQ